ncbi:MAG: hypothetical protein A2271_03320 [Candidatus Moranbacteria bacterium RIFOXYA12_FULL_35_19]|nr:MAG: hypothetical protein UR78_C0019G0005 [Candidatus Moranbacteria bacterium GW2011_GWF2_35_39]OGI30722.1 MAG: hypothetical protein A2343_03040 [Candidatus Moranbacteria bacterium RIFOXYB12_FULL_35_8]OGI33407.1 MAG: hypothetical protein A2489_03450 [Candidatus Moranbacteria bacterium RIFOXYC12_FULL_36_13]OGI36342.1 MAG: hypothetical protein A2271_03320 [Candidatus Moranbacteria bacterium RIFOXYA12_FULL_35_19]
MKLISRDLLGKVLKELKLIPTKQIIDRVIVLLPSRNLITSKDEKLGLDDDILDDIKLRLSTLDGTVKKFTKKIRRVVKKMPI